MNQLGEQQAKILAYTLAVKKFEAQIVTFQKQQLSLNEQLTFQANEIYAKDEKLKRYRRIGMKATDNFKGVPHPLTGDYTPKQQEEIDDSLYVYGKKGPQKSEISDSDVNSTEHSTCQSTDIITNEKVVSESKEVEPSCVTHVKTPRKQMKNQKTHEVKRKNRNEMMGRELVEGYSFIKKKCFICGSLSHLIKDCDYYEKKMAREAELKKQRVFNTGNGVAKPVWNNVYRVNHANHFVSRPVQLNAVTQNVNSVRPNVNTGRVNVNSVRHNVNSVKTNVNTGRSKQPVPTCNLNSFSPVRPQGNWGTVVKTSAGYNWRRTRPNSNYNSGSNFVRTDHPLKNMKDRGIFDSGCSGHMTGNKDHLEDFEEFKGGSVTFGGSKGYIIGKGRIKVGNLEFDSVSFVKEVGFDMKTPSPAKGFACLIAKATSDESKLWHGRFSWVFFLATKDETSGILQNFIRQIENQLNHRVKIIRSDNGTEFKNRDMLEFCGNKGIKQEYSNARTPQQNRVAERMKRTLIEAARTMLAD
ncbi:putative ribonuclease H-like domain-containing protein [Tanacetum coccineum]